MLDNRGQLKERIPCFLISMAHPAKLTGEAANEWIDKAYITGKTRQGKRLGAILVRKGQAKHGF